MAKKQGKMPNTENAVEVKFEETTHENEQIPATEVQVSADSPISKNSKKKEKPVKEKKEKKSFKEIISTKKTEHRNFKHGVHENKDTDPALVPGQISRYLNQLLIEEGTEDIIKAYAEELTSGKLHNFFFNKKEKIFPLVEKFYTLPVGSAEAECNIMDLTRRLAIIRRQIINKPFKDEHFNLKARQQSYASGKIVHGEDVLKEVAWAVTHAYVTGLFMNTKGIFDLIPKANDTVIPIWNAYIFGQMDISDEVKEIFTINNEGTCPFLENHRKQFCSVPPEDIAFDTAADVGSISICEVDAKEKHKELDQQFHAAVDNDVDPKGKPVKKNTVKIKTVPAGENSFNITKKDSVNPAEIAMNLPQTQEYVKVLTDPNVQAIQAQQNMMPAIEQLPSINMIEANNTQWHEAIPRLDKFTAMINEAKMKVIYNPDNVYQGMVRATLLDEKDQAIRELMLDNCLLYGDTLRVATPTGDDIRKWLFLPISQKNVMVKLINGKLTRKDTDELRSKMPKCLTDFRKKYNFFDRVDMRGLTYPEDDNRYGYPFDSWKFLVINISTILNDEQCPACRFRIVDLESPKKFKLVCDANTRSVFPSEILDDPSNMEAIARGFYVVYDKDAVKNGHIPYSFHDVNNPYVPAAVEETTATEN